MLACLYVCMCIYVQLKRTKLFFYFFFINLKSLQKAFNY